MIVPVALFFDKNYLIPASVAITSLLMNSNRNYEYHIHVFYNDIPDDDISTLSELCSGFSNARFFSRDMGGRFLDLFSKTKTKGHYTKEMYYKFLVPSLMPDYPKAIVTDVDVVFLGDVSSTFENSIRSPDTLIAGCKVPAPYDSLYGRNIEKYRSQFSDDEIAKLNVGGGYYVFNLDAMRREGVEKKLIDVAHINAYRLKQPEQDVISLVCHPRIEILPLASMICSYCYDIFSESDSFEKVPGYSAEDVKLAINNPIQLHFATRVKPWNTPGSTKSEVWHKYICMTPFLKSYLESLDNRDNFDIQWAIKMPFSRRKMLSVIRKRDT
ncbi:glycosyltransferase [Thioclava sp. F36-6]|uniref:glycosyltransferase family 8 protein n=1 Tax=Thioclava sp. F36-6 TaxID=1915316 RepID=UPI0009960CB9|nr:glycosyltransferase [Thioclava sp. F36-6]OOY31571.1 hypothetical protein BMI88_10840 [Thioclava sp. F36-6]